MAGEKEIKVKNKQEAKKAGESTRNLPVYYPDVDIYETKDKLVITADLPGVSPENVEIDLKDDVLTIKATVNLYGEKEKPILTEYEVGDYYRQFMLAKTIDQSKIEAVMKDGVLKLILPKAEAAKPRKIEVKAL